MIKILNFKQMKRIFLVLVLLVSVTFVFAQKTVYVHRDSVYANMPEMQIAQTELEVYLGQIEAEIGSMQQEYQQKVQVYQNNVDSYSDAVKNNKIVEIQNLEKRIQDFQTAAQAEYIEKQKELIIPIKLKFDNAIEVVRKKMKADVVCNFGADIMYVAPKYIITDEVMAELGISL